LPTDIPAILFPFLNCAYNEEDKRSSKAAAVILNNDIFKAG
jgi:hypothetical protein